MRTLVVTSRPPTSRVSGYDVRVAHLCEHVPGERHLAIIGLGEAPHETTEDPTEDPADDVPGFASTHRLGQVRRGRARRRRHLRLSDRRFLQSAWPQGHRAVVDSLRRLLDELDVDLVVVFGGDLAEVVEAAGAPRTVLDVCDSGTLTLRRELEVARPAGLRARVDSWLAVRRSAALEATLVDRFDLVTTVSEPDSDAIRTLSRPGAEVVTVPNGVDDRFLGGMLPVGRAHGLAFWGNLSFAPNEDCLRYFLDEVFGPHLRADGVSLRVIGPHAPDWLVELAATEPLVELLGFVPDLREALADVPLAMNAMRIGSGLKNKVLEAFGLGLVVVSSARGVEALTGVTDGAEVAVADDPAAFAAAVRALLADEAARVAMREAAHALLRSQYTWSTVGSTWRDLLLAQLR